jgi:hypothetical protein
LSKPETDHALTLYSILSERRFPWRHGMNNIALGAYPKVNWATFCHFASGSSGQPMSKSNYMIPQILDCVNLPFYDL